MGKCALCGKEAELNDQGICPECKQRIHAEVEDAASMPHRVVKRKRNWVPYAIFGIIAVILLICNWVIGLTFISIASTVFAFIKFKSSKKVFTAFLILAVVSFSLIFIISPNSNGGGNLVQDDAESYIQNHYQDFSEGSFEKETISVNNMDNNEYIVTGKMLDNGGWEHDIKAGIQISPNQSHFLVCYLWIDGKNYVMNQPRVDPNTSKEEYEGNYAESAIITENSESETLGGQIEVDPDSSTFQQ